MWIFCSLRQNTSALCGRGIWFQFRCGFSVPCDGHVALIDCDEAVSIPLWIFCSLRQPTAAEPALIAAGFNSVVDFLFPATKPSIRDVRIRQVSIPLWIFCSLRPDPRQGSETTNDVSIPLWIFCSLRPIVERIISISASMFQFRCGFSVPCDTFTCSIRSRIPCFNSVVDFLFPATDLSVDDLPLDDLFQFRCGFSVPCDH